MRTEWLHKQELKHLLAALMPENRLALEISLETGLRIGDVLNLRTEAVAKADDGRLTVRELKTGKNRRIRLPHELHDRAIANSGKLFVFENRLSAQKHRTRQAVFKDIKRIAKAFRIRENVAPHTARKCWAVEQYHKTQDIKRVQKLLNHESEAVTVLYAMADCLVARRRKRSK